MICKGSVYFAVFIIFTFIFVLRCLAMKLFKGNVMQLFVEDFVFTAMGLISFPLILNATSGVCLP